MLYFSSTIRNHPFHLIHSMESFLSVMEEKFAFSKIILIRHITRFNYCATWVVINDLWAPLSGTSMQGRTELRNLLDFVRAGDELVITLIDRFARSVVIAVPLSYAARKLTWGIASCRAA